MIHNPRARLTRAGLVAVYALLLGLLTLTTFWPAPVAGASPWPILAVKLVPLLVFLPGLVRGHNRTLIWMSFVLLVYFTLSFMAAWSGRGDWPHWSLAGVSLLLFMLALCHIRLNRQ